MPGATERRLSLLAVCENAPSVDPTRGTGSTLISAHVLAELPEDFDLTVAYFGDRTSTVDARVLDRAQRVLELPMVPLAAGKAVQPFVSLPSASWIRCRPAARRTVRSLSAEADVTYLHGPQTFALASDVQGPVVAHEIDPSVDHFHQLAETNPGPRALYWRMQARRFARIERATAERAERIVLVSRDDADRLGRSLGVPIAAIPNGTPAPLDPRPESDVDDMTVVFAGSLGYRPNVEAIERLVHSIMPLVWADAPRCRLVLAGRSPTPGVTALASDRVEIHPDVPSLLAEFRAAAVSCYPGTMGLGSKNCVRESLAAGCPVVCTPESARGFPDAGVLTVAESAADLAAGVVALLRDPARRERSGERGRRSLERLPRWPDVSAAFADLFREAAAGDGVPPPPRPPARAP